eukprot:TRINITY_DN6141_c0_g1_i1.p1 TRINITY_DN6141_c0_g1~~TRINITY_DN6141_c0_g1_i1.p1  ORF type:complete len:1112 (+),score=336.03 TRINITY_DN6141_c0_g1_i1:63-3398(+)
MAHLPRDASFSSSFCGSEVCNAEPTRHLQNTVKLPITALLAITMLISSSASIAGGLLMYFESLKSLEATVSATSKSEMATVMKTLNDTVFGIVNRQEAMINVMYQPGQFAPNSTREEWTATVRQYAWSQMAADSLMKGLGITLIPHLDTPEEVETYAYMMMWSDPVGDGKRVLVMGHPYTFDDSASKPQWNETTGQYQAETPTYEVDQGDGSRGQLVYTWDAKKYLTAMGNFSATEHEYVDGSVTDTGYQKPLVPSKTHRTLGQQVREPETWFGPAPEKILFAYSAWDTIYAPPPPPHPWSGYRGVYTYCQWDYSDWVPPVQKFAEDHPGTTLVVYHEKFKHIFATTTGETPLDQVCAMRLKEQSHHHDCMIKIDHNPHHKGEPEEHPPLTADLSVREVYRAFKAWEVGVDESERQSHFMKMRAGGVEVFARREAMGFMSKYVLWIQPTSSVQDKVNAALTLLILFSVLVFAFDVVLSGLEYIFVAKPMKDLSDAIVAMGSMDTNPAERVLEKQAQSSFMVSEVYTLVEGMMRTVQNLNEYRTFIPPQLLQTKRSSEAGETMCDVAIVFTDIRASTALWSRHEDAMAAALRLHNQVIRGRIIGLGGLEVKTIGDSFMVAFPSAATAVQFSLAIQTDLMKVEWPEDLLEHPLALMSEDGAWNGLRIRVGVNWGTAEMVEQKRGQIDYFGTVVNVAARVEGVCAPGAVCITDAVLEEVGDMLREDDPVQFPLGGRKLKGIDSDVTLHLLVPRELTARAKLVGATVAGRVDDAVASDVTSVCTNSRIVPRALGEFLERKRHAVGRTQFRFGKDGLSALSQPMKVVQQALGAVIAALQDTHGTLHFMYGTAVVVSWPQVRRLEHTGNAFAYVDRLADALERCRGGSACQASTGLTVGNVLAGNIGADPRRQRFTTVLGAPLTLAGLLSESCAALPSALALYAPLGECAALEYPPLKRKMRPVDRWAVETVGVGNETCVRSLTVYEVKRSSESQECVSNMSSRQTSWAPRSPGRSPGALNPLGHVYPSFPRFNDHDDVLLRCDDWGFKYWRAFEAGELAEYECTDPVVAAVRDMQMRGAALRLPLAEAVLGLSASEFEPPARGSSVRSEKELVGDL